jgi:uracil-DNA glycosylase family 4
MTGKLEKFEELKQIWGVCTKCPLSSLRTQVVFGHGNLDADLAMIGEAPGEQEDKHGTPFVGPAGEQFNRLLAAVGLNRESLWITNTCLCRPKETKPGKSNRAPKSCEMQACFPRLYDEMNIVRPKIIVLAGNTPLLLATGKRGITSHRGWQKDTKWVGEGFATDKIYATLHPASLLYGSKDQILEKKQAIYKDWLEITRMLSVIKAQESGIQNGTQG